MPNGKSKRKGYLGELNARKLFQKKGFLVKWHSEDPTYPDLTLDDKITCEVKYGTKVPKTLYKWFKEKNPDILLIRRISRKDKTLPWLVVMDANLFGEMAGKIPYKHPGIPTTKKELKKSLKELRKEFGIGDPKKYKEYVKEDEERSKIKINKKEKHI